MKKLTLAVLIISLLLVGCSQWMDGSYSAVTPHTEPTYQSQNTSIAVVNYEQLYASLITLVEKGTESAVLSWRFKTEDLVRVDMETAVSSLMTNNPFAAYAVENIRYELGTSGNQTAASVHISYYANRAKPEKIQRIQTLSQVKSVVESRLNDCAAGVVLYFDHVEQVDYDQMVADYALAYPQKVMEAPEVTVSLYPEEGSQQVVELKFTYQSSRESLRTMQNMVSPVFSSAAQYAGDDYSHMEKASRLYTFLMNRYVYNIQTSITPAYSLLLHGVGDNRAFAMVYGAMCRNAGIDCQIVTGTRAGEPWVWNVMLLDGEYYHLDLLQSDENGEFTLRTGQEMMDYVWDYSDYPINLEENE